MAAFKYLSADVERGEKICLMLVWKAGVFRGWQSIELAVHGLQGGAVGVSLHDGRVQGGTK